MNSEKFSVSMCVYGGDEPNHFKVAVESILNQTVMPDEVVLVVDGPVPEELNTIICEYEANELFNVIRFTENQGHGNARRAGLDACKNELVAIMDADDVAMSDRFEQQIKLFCDDTDIVGGDISEFIDSEDNIVSYRKVPCTDSEIKEYLKKRCPFNQMTVMFKKSSVLAAGGYIDLFWNEDYYLWIRMSENGAKMKNTGTVLVNARVGADMYKRRGGRKYFKSEKFLQKYMLDKKIITRKIYLSNIAKRWILQVLLPNSIRGWVFKKFARS